MGVRLLGFLGCVTVLVLVEGSVLRAEDQVVHCAETKVKAHGQCVSEASSCQAVENFSLALKCSLCDDKDTVQWFFSPGHQMEDFHHLSQQSKTLLLTAVNVTEKASGCYQCQCGSGEVKKGMYFSVQVGLPVPPTFLVDTVEDSSPTDLDLIPSIRNVPLEETSPGVVCINCSATGYPNLQYRWYYNDYGGDWKNVSSDPCLMFQDNQPEVLCFTPTIQNVQQQRTYYCKVSNIVQTVTAHQSIMYPGFAESSDWFVRPHQLQSRGEIPVIDGTATAICAAYQQTEVFVQVDYYVCALPDTADANLSACLFNNLTCCSCRDDSCPLGINVTNHRFVDSLGIPTVGCRVDSVVKGHFVCVVEKNASDSTGGSYSAKQFIGNFTFGPEKSTPFCLSASVTHTPWEVVLVVTSASGGAILGAILVLVIVCLVAIGRCYVRHKRNAVEGRRGRQVGVYIEEEAEEGERRPLLEDKANSTASQSMNDYNTMPQSCVSVIASFGEVRSVVSQWKLTSDGSLELPTRPEPGTKYLLEVCASDESCVRIPVLVAACVSDNVQAPLKQGPGLAQDAIPTGDPSLPSASVSSVSKPSHVRNLSVDFAPSDPSPCKSVSTLPYSPPADPTHHSSSLLSPASPSAAPYPKVTLTEEPDQAVEVAWSVDTMMKKTIGMFQVQPMCKYSLEIPSQQETVVLKFEAFGKTAVPTPTPSPAQTGTPSHSSAGVRQVSSSINSTSLFTDVPFDMCHVCDFIPDMAPRWFMIGDKLQLHTEVELLKSRHEGNDEKCQSIISSAIQQEKLTSWQQLLEVLESDAVKLPNIARKIREKYSCQPTSTSTSIPEAP